MFTSLMPVLTPPTTRRTLSRYGCKYEILWVGPSVYSCRPIAIQMREIQRISDDADSESEWQVCAYVNDIIAHSKQTEAKYMADPNYLANMQSASGLATRHRVSLIDWTTEVHRKFKTLRQETLFLAINIIDRLLSKRQVTLPPLATLASFAAATPHY